ncbi:FAD-dependent oxidoreductase [Geminocystis sp. CENA526]|uniref:FAD-dependent oxidoreductase n=1 Tax=Geminocystis sp. CENA526 TaxID=1355871 RepID=UPI003D6DFB3E
MMKNDYDLVVIGGTKQGFFCAEYAVKLGARVALVIDDKLASIEHEQDFLLLNNGISYQEFLQEKKRIIEYKILPDLEVLGVDIIFSQCKFIQQKQLILFTEKRQLKSSAYLLVMTANQLFSPLSPLYPPLVRGELTLNNLLDEKTWHNLPEELTILGDDINTIYLVNKLSQENKKISIISASSQILPSEDEDISYQLQLFLEGKGIKIYLNHNDTGLEFDRATSDDDLKTQRVTTSDDDLKTQRVTTSDDKLKTQRVTTPDDKLKTLRVTTLTKNLSKEDNLELTKLGIKNNGGKIEVNSKLQTKHPQIYACGDLLGGYALESLIPYEVKIAVNNALFFPYQEINYSDIPYTLNTNPPINRLGYTEKQAKFLLSQNIKVLKIYCLLTSPINWQQEVTFLKIILDESNYLLGFHSFGFGVEELITAMTFIKKRNLPFYYLFKMSFANLNTQKLITKINNYWKKEQRRQYQIILDLAETFFIWKRA